MFSTNSRDSFVMKAVSIISVLVLVVGVFPMTVSAATFFTSDFESNDFSAWTSGQPENGNWTIDNSGHVGKAARVKGDNNTSKTLYKTLSTTGYQNVTVTFWYKADGTLSGNGEDDYVKLQWWNGSATTTLFTINHDNDANANDNSGWHQVTISNISGANNLSTFKLIFAADLDHANDTVMIDDVSVTRDVMDVTAPDTSITSGPTGTVNSNSATFTFTSTETPSTFKCKLDGGSYATCTTPKNYTGLSEGSHTFSVKATDASGNEDSTPATRTWTVDTTGPTVSISSPLNSAVTESAGSIGYAVGDSSTVACTLDTVLVSCSLGGSYAFDLSDGSHTFTIQGTDGAGNSGNTASVTWTVETPVIPDACENVPDYQLPGPTCEDIVCLATLGNIWNGSNCINPVNTAEECAALEPAGFWNGDTCEEVPTCNGNQDYNVQTNECVDQEIPPTCAENQTLIEGECVDNEVTPPECTENCDGCEVDCGEENQIPASEPQDETTNSDTGHINATCENNEDDDNDGLYDANDPGCENSSDSSEENPVGGIGNGEVAGASCGPILNAYLGLRGKENDPEAVKIVQEFLNKELGLSLEVNGEYNEETIEAVKAFQTKYSTDVLGPWGISDSTGIVYLTTQRMINMISCPGLDLPIPELK